jgi:hypothetical protein
VTVAKRRTPSPASSPASSDQPRTDTDGIEVEDFGLEFDTLSPSTNAVSASPPAPPIVGVAESVHSSLVWHLSHSDGRQEGPLLTEVIRLRLANGTLSYESLIWRPRMAKWGKAASVPELQSSSAAADTNACPNPVGQIDWMSSANILLIASLGVWGVSSLGGYWGYSWFTGGLLLFLGFLTSRGFADILERLSRIEARLSSCSGGDNRHD